MFISMQMCIMSSSFCFIFMSWRVMLCIANQSCPSRLVCTEVTYSAIISARSGYDHAAIGHCCGLRTCIESVVGHFSPRQHYIPGGLKMVMRKLELAARAQLILAPGLVLPSRICLSALLVDCHLK